MHYHHAYLYAGPVGSGKHAAVEKAVADLVPSGSMLDIMRLAPERDPETGKMRDIPIEQTKVLKAWISLRPTGEHKVVVIDDADRLGGEAANNLLKAIEEPPAYAHFFLLTTKPGEVMGTIVSRCERVDFQGTGFQQTPEAMAAVKQLSAALKMSVAQRITYAKTLSDDQDAPEIVGYWLAYAHSQLMEKPHLIHLVRQLLDLSAVLAEPQYNRRLAIEHFLLTASVQK